MLVMIRSCLLLFIRGHPIFRISRHTSHPSLPVLVFDVGGHSLAAQLLYDSPSPSLMHRPFRQTMLGHIKWHSKVYNEWFMFIIYNQTHVICINYKQQTQVCHQNCKNHLPKKSDYFCAFFWGVLYTRSIFWLLQAMGLTQCIIH